MCVRGWVGYNLLAPNAKQVQVMGGAVLNSYVINNPPFPWIEKKRAYLEDQMFRLKTFFPLPFMDSCKTWEIGYTK